MVLAVVIASRLTVILSDVITLSVTWRYVYRIKREAMKAGMHSPLATILLKTGTLYFTCVESAFITAHVV